ncbi:MAG: SGNH/GDSL hydrolase family protein [Chloroflexi bacterium]|nr:SGNH/GDSL hydrolase family protein [Chloroflexota bacterium]
MTRRLKTPVIITALSILTILIVELLARSVALPLISAIRHSRQADSTVYIDAEFDVATLVAEISGANGIRYEPYVIWKRKPYIGSLVNVDQDGNRVTHFNSDEPDALKIWMFGGSTIWGWGAPDFQTVPSLLSRNLNEDWGVDTVITNFGEDGYVSTQEMILFLRELQSDRTPDLVIFYDGANDAAAAALWPQIPGVHHNLSSVKGKLEDRKPTFSSRIRSLAIFKVLNIALRQVGLDTNASIPAGTALAAGREDDAALTARRAFDILLQNRKIISALEDAYGFRSLFMFQPALGIGDKPLTSEEESMYAISLARPEGYALRMGALMRPELLRYLKSGSAADNVFDMSNVFKNTTETVYLDWAHLSGEGNRLVAEKMSGIVRGVLCDDTPPNMSQKSMSQISANCG